jgi:hypothetical protein
MLLNGSLYHTQLKSTATRLANETVSAERMAADRKSEGRGDYLRVV